MTAHVISRCRWDQTLDAPEAAASIPDLVSRWSREVMPGIAGECFRDLCPAGMVWRLDRLELDLGRIPRDELWVELPRRFAAALRNRLTDLWLHDPPQQGGRHIVFDERGRIPDLLAAFLSSGMMPWWYGGDGSAPDIWDSYRLSDPAGAASLLRSIGDDLRVRRRFVSQFREERTRDAVHLLEPSHGDSICDWADRWFAAQKESRYPQCRPEDFRSETWFLVLTHLLVDRGTLFNTVTFARSVIMGIANRFQVEYRTLLERLYAASLLAEEGAVRRHRFFSVLQMLQDEIAKTPEASPPPQDVDYWSEFRALLRHRKGDLHKGLDRHSLADLLQTLKAASAPRLAVMVRDEAAGLEVRRAMIRHLGDRGLTSLVVVLEPDADDFVLAHVERMRTVAEMHYWGMEAVWEIVIGYLILQHSSQFVGSQFVHHTIDRLSRKHRVAYLRILEALLFCAENRIFAPQRYALQRSLLELRANHLRKHPLERAWQTSYRARRFADQVNGTEAALADRDDARATLFALLDADGPGNSSELRLMPADGASWPGDRAVSEQLVTMAAEVRLAALLQWLAPDETSFCLELLGLLRMAVRTGWLPSLRAIDAELALCSAVIRALPGFGRLRAGTMTRFGPERFWSLLTAALAGDYKIAIAAFVEDCRIILDLVPGGGGLALARCLAGATAADGEEVEPADGAAEPSGDWSEMLAVIVGPKAGSDRAALERAWQRCAAGQAKKLADAIGQRPDRTEIARRLATALPLTALDLLDAPPWSAGGAAGEKLAVWIAMVEATEHWQGADSTLVRVLTEVAWQTTLGIARPGGGHPHPMMRFLLEVARRLSIPLEACRMALGQVAPHGSEVWASLRHDLDRVLGLAGDDRDATRGLPNDTLFHSKLAEVVQSLLKDGRMPMGWVGEPWDLSQILFDLSQMRPNELRRAVRGCAVHPAAWYRLLAGLPLNLLRSAMVRAGGLGSIDDLLVRRWGEELTRSNWSIAERAILTGMLHETLLRAWLDQERGAVTVAGLAEAFFMALRMEQEQLSQRFVRHLAERGSALPPRLREDLMNRAKQGESEVREKKKAPASANPKRKSVGEEIVRRVREPFPTVQSTPIDIANAGLVLVQHYVPMLFERLGFVERGQFVSHHARQVGVNCLQFLVTGHGETPEHYLVLNKLLCGCRVRDPLDYGVELSPTVRETCESLLSTIIGHWPAAKNTSIEGLRGNWLVRPGTLSEAPDKWDLIVERRPWDVLLSSFPLSYSVIKFPWMEKPTYVTWPT